MGESAMQGAAMQAAAPQRRSAHRARLVANGLTLLRIALVPVWLALAVQAAGAQGRSAPHAALVLVFAAIGLSDVVDGWVARRWAVASRTGAVLDAVADKLAQVTAVTFLALWTSPAFAPLPVWLLAALVLRDALLGSGWLLAHRLHRHVGVEHRWHGKASSLLLFVLLLGVSAGARGPGVALLAAGVVLLVGCSTGAYVLAGGRELFGTRARGSRGAAR